jgi:hypothetical protein
MKAQILQAPQAATELPEPKRSAESSPQATLRQQHPPTDDVNALPF